MAQDLEPAEPSRSPSPESMRISDAERDSVAEILREATAVGRLSMEEFEERLDQVHAARTYADLVPLTVDLPQASTLPQPAGSTSPVVPPGSRVVSGPRSGKGVAILGGLDRSGEWVVPETFHVVAFMGGARLDLRRARFSAPEVVLDVKAFMGGCEIIVDDHTRVIMEGIGIMGGFSEASGNTLPRLSDDSPVVRIRGLAVWGGVAVFRKRWKTERPR